MRASRLILLGLLMAALAASGCMRRPAPLPIAEPVIVEPAPVPPPVIVAPAIVAPAVVPAPVLVEGPLAEPPYTLDSGDRLRVVVFGQENLSNSYSVDAGGFITMPLIGAVPARDRTTAALASAIAAKLRNGYVREPHVAVEIEAYRPFFILGEVTAPGQYPYVANMTAETAVAIAGGFTPRAWKKTVEVSRPEHGELYRGKVPLVSPVRPGDTIVVSERWF
jgi:polysaccharide export outer membrane protein